MKGEARPVPPSAMKPHLRAVIAYLREVGATGIVVTQPKHYRVAFDLRGPRMLTVATTPKAHGRPQINHARQALQRMGAI